LNINLKRAIWNGLITGVLGANVDGNNGENLSVIMNNRKFSIIPSIYQGTSKTDAL